MGNLTHGGDIYSLPQQDKILDFSSNINPLGFHPSAKQAVEWSIRDCIRYPDPLCRDLTANIAKYEGVPSANIVCGNGAADLIFRLVLCKKPKRALLPAPTFSEYEHALRTIDCEIEYFYLCEEDGFQLTEAILAAIHPELDIVFLCNPNNPTGVLADPKLLLRILDACEENDVLLISDESFNGFLENPEAHTLKNQLERYKDLFVLKSLTKLYAIPGLRLGYGICSDELFAEALQDCGQTWSVSVPAQAAGNMLLSLKAYEEDTRALIKEQRRWLKEHLTKLGFKVYDSAANYIFVRCAEEKLKEYLITQNILIRDCSNYEGLGRGYYRFAVLDAAANHELIKALQK